jgi:hypothetical protein
MVFPLTPTIVSPCWDEDPSLAKDRIKRSADAWKNASTCNVKVRALSGRNGNASRRLCLTRSGSTEICWEVLLTRGQTQRASPTGRETGAWTVSRSSKGPRRMVDEDGRVPIIDIGALAKICAAQ